jgi:putative ABC transport system substrate-binding protein
MRRRELFVFLGGAAAVWPLVASAQPPGLPVIGFLGATSPGAGVSFLAAFHAGLKESGYVEGRNVSIAFRWAEGRFERLPALAAELVALKVAVIVGTNHYTALAAKKATQAIPIAFLSGDAVGEGLVASLGRPGGNATGVSIQNPELAPKRLELLRDLIPNARSVAFIVNPANPTVAAQVRDVQAAARGMGLALQIQEAGGGDDIEPALGRLAERRPDALLVQGDPAFIGQRERIVALVARQAIPAIYDFPDFAAAGGLISHGPSLKDTAHLLGVYTGKILAGARPADLPVQQPTRFELVVNQKTARALGLTIPPAVLARADEVIE